jgi:hypothetical protein
MKANQYPVDMDFTSESGYRPLVCCMDDIAARTDDVSLGDIVACDECGIEMVLTKCEDGVLRWRAV